MLSDSSVSKPYSNNSDFMQIFKIALLAFIIYFIYTNVLKK